MLYYCPLESYKERYTMQWSAPITGWLERNWIKAGIEYQRIDTAINMERENIPIKTGLVLDIEKRTNHCFSQIKQLVDLAVKGVLTNNDIIYFDDFWHLGIEALPYAFHQLGINPKMFAFCHAQSVDIYDFTYPMKEWIRPFEKGIGRVMDGVFVNSDLLRNLLIREGVVHHNKVHVIGHIFCSEEVKERFPKQLPKRENTVVFSSRWDDEKNPQFFLAVAENVLAYRSDIQFIICTSAKTLKSNDTNNLIALKKAMDRHPNDIILKTNLSKEYYYLELLEAKIQMNTANQDWVSIVLLEASTAGCYPLYPKFRSFPQALRGQNEYMYPHLDVEEAANKITALMEHDKNFLWSASEIKDRAWIHERHDMSWARMINIMLGENTVEVEPYE